MLRRRTGLDRGVRLWATGQEGTEERPGLAVQLVTAMNLGCCLGHKVHILSGNSPGCMMSEGLPGTTFSGDGNRLLATPRVGCTRQL
jgi:hypothetical protein